MLISEGFVIPTEVEDSVSQPTVGQLVMPPSVETSFDMTGICYHMAIASLVHSSHVDLGVG
jgi:hypothetical protein